MKKFTIDLHNHSPLITNDYKGSPNTSSISIVQAAVSAGIDVLAISDHFSVDYYENVYEAAQHVYLTTGKKVLILPGSELKIRWNNDEVHLITLFPPEESKTKFEELMNYLKVSKTQRVVSNLPSIVVETDPVEVAIKTNELGGICYLAHVDRYFGSYRFMDSTLLDEIISNAPISAIEIINIETRYLLKHRTNGITYIQSSDSHCNEEIGRRVSTIKMADLSFESLKEAFSKKSNLQSLLALQS